MTTTTVTLYRISPDKKLVPVGTLSRIGFTPGLLAEAMKNVVDGITPPIRHEELRHIMTFDCPSAPSVVEPHVIDVGDHFSLKVDEFITMHDSGAGPAHCSTIVSLLASGPRSLMK